MALYHFHVARVLRSRGQSSVEAAAYRAGEKLEDHYYGKTADYTHKGGVICSEIMAPDYVPESFHNRETLWNAVEDVEKHPKAQLAYSFDIALQNEFRRPGDSCRWSDHRGFPPAIAGRGGQSGP